MADTKVLEAFAVRCAGSSPVPGTKQNIAPNVIGQSPATDFGTGIWRVCVGKIIRHMSVVTESSSLMCIRQTIVNTL